MGSQDVLPLNLIALLSWGHDKRKARDFSLAEKQGSSAEKPPKGSLVGAASAQQEQ